MKFSQAVDGREVTFSARQSLLSSFEQCPRRAVLGMEVDDDLTIGNVGSSADLGSAFHAIAAEILRTLWRQGEQQIPTQEAVEIMYEILADGADRLNVSTGETTRQRWILPAQDRDDLRWMVLGFAGRKWRPDLILPDGTDLDPKGGRLSADIMGPDLAVRTLTGQPDLIIADPPDGVIIIDYKSGKGQVKAPRDDRDAEFVQGKQYLSERGHFQLDSYGLMAMRKYPSVQRAILRELHLRSGKVREAMLGREELEHVEREIGLHLMLLDQAVQGEEEPRPRPGAWCARRCPVSASCPVPEEQRGVGSLGSRESADAAAGRYVMVDGLRNHLREALKTYHEQTGEAPMVGDGTALFWREKDDGRRAFGVWPVEDIPAPPEDVDLELLLRESVERAARKL